jgi:hypothetical protein
MPTGYLNVTNREIVLSPRLYFSYILFLVFDGSVKLPGCDWTPEHSAQGFARRESTVNFNTLLEFGFADVAVIHGAYQPREEYERVIEVPFRVTSGKVIVGGPEETEDKGMIELPPGDYRLTAAQRVTAEEGEGEEEEAIDLFFEVLPQPLERSSVLVADEALSVPNRLLETAEVAGES